MPLFFSTRYLCHTIYTDKRLCSGHRYTLYLVCFYFFFVLIFRRYKTFACPLVLSINVNIECDYFLPNGIRPEEQQPKNEYFKIKTHKNWNDIYKSRLCWNLRLNGGKKKQIFCSHLLLLCILCLQTPISCCVAHIHSTCRKNIYTKLACIFSCNYIFYPNMNYKFSASSRCTMEWDCIVCSRTHRLIFATKQNNVK